MKTRGGKTLRLPPTQKNSNQDRPSRETSEVN